MLHVTLDRFDQVWNQVISTGKLHIDLCERILHSIAQVHQFVVNANYERNQNADYCEEYQK